MAVSDFRLNSNEVFASIFNFIISQQVFADNIKGTNSHLVEMARVDGSLYGDTKTYYATDILGSVAWGGHTQAVADSLLELNRPMDPDLQKITLDQFRQISLTLDRYLSKRAWGTEGVFAEFMSVVSGAVADTKRVYDSTLYNAYIGTETAEGAGQNIEFAVSTPNMEAQEIAAQLADLVVELTDVNREYNDYGNLRSYDAGDLKFIWNSKYVNKIKKIDLPTIFHSEGLVDHLGEHVLPSKYFGNVLEEGGTADGTQRSLIEYDYNTMKRDEPGYDKAKHVFPGQIIPTGETYKAFEAYTVDENIICKILVKMPPLMSAFEVGTSFFNPKSLTENRYLTWGYNTLEYLKNYPLITIKKNSKAAAAAKAK